MRFTFKQYLVEAAVQDRILHLVKQLLGSDELQRVEHVDDQLLDFAREESHRFVESSLGNWLISIFKTRGSTFARVEPPHHDTKPSYYFPKVD